MDSQTQRAHFVLIPLMAQGHMIPMIDIAKLLAQHGLLITIVTTVQNGARFESVLARAIDSGLNIRIACVDFPFEEVGLPKGCDNIDLLPSLGLAGAFFRATFSLGKATEKLFARIKPQPNCIISDAAIPWTTELANKYQIPRISFYCASCFYLLSRLNLQTHNALDSVASESEYFSIPYLPDQVELTKSQLYFMTCVEFPKLANEIIKSDLKSYGVLVNTFEELEPDYVKEYKKARGTEKVWCAGPVSLSNKETLDKVQRGNKASIDEHQCLNWLDRQQPGSVIYVSLGSLCNVILAQMIELGLGLDESNKPFIWVIRQGHTSEELEKWILEYGFEEKIRERGLLIRGWAPQVLILSHHAVGGFITHCGWNSTTEAISAGVPVITWPLFGDQFFNEKFIVQILKVGISLGVDKCVIWGDEEKVGVLVKKENIRDAVCHLMDGDEGVEIRKRARELGEKAKRAMEEGGSSNLNMSLFIEDIMNQAGSAKST